MAVLNKDEAYKGVVQYHTGLSDGEIGEYVIIPGDPFRTDVIAKYFDNPKLLHHLREHKSWTGTYKGVKVSVVSTGMGCPSTAIAVEELINVGAKCIVRLGTCAGFADDVNPGNICITTGAYKQEGTSKRYVPEAFPAVPDLDLTSLMIKTAKEMTKDLSPEFAVKTGITCSDDAFYAENPEWIEHCYKLGCMNVEMESSSIYTIAHLRKVRAATICAAAANLHTGVDFIDEENTITPKAIEIATQIVLETFYKFEQAKNNNELLK